MQDQADAGADHRAVDADVLQIAAEEQLQLAGRLGGVPPLDGPGDKFGEVVVEMIGERPGPGLDHPLQAVGEAAVRTEAAAGRGQQVGQPAAQLGLWVRRLSAQGILGA